MLPELNDEITRVISGETYPAYVYSGKAAGAELNFDPGGQPPIFVGYSPGRTIYAVMEPQTVWRRNDEALWNGEKYIVSGIAHRRDIDGDDHHTTMTLQVPDAST